jgi:hypothetical protein
MAPGGLVRLRHAMAGRVARARDRFGGGRRPQGAVVVSYAPDPDGDADTGEVVWAWVPYEEDATQGKDRPVLILGHDGPLLVGVPLSSRSNGHRHDAEEWVPVGTGGWDRQRRPSHADTGRLLRLAPGEVRREGSALERTAFDRVVQRVSEVHAWTDRPLPPAVPEDG